MCQPQITPLCELLFALPLLLHTLMSPERCTYINPMACHSSQPNMQCTTQVRRYEEEKLPEGAVVDEQTVGRLTGE